MGVRLNTDLRHDTNPPRPYLILYRGKDEEDSFIISCHQDRETACRRAKDNWSGHEVGFMPQRMPLKRVTTSATFIPSTNRAMP